MHRILFSVVVALASMIAVGLRLKASPPSSPKRAFFAGIIGFIVAFLVSYLLYPRFF